MTKTYRILLAVISILIFSFSAVSQQNGEELIKKMYALYAGKWYHTLTFNQTTDVYRNDSLNSTQTWYESIVFPSQFRIDFGPKDSGNAAIFTADSVYIFKNGQLQRARINDNDLIFLLGGLYFYPLEQTIQKLKSLGFDLSKIHQDRWKGKAVWVIGDTSAGKNGNQLWLDSEHFFLVRMLEFNSTRKEEGIFEDQIFEGGGWTETKASFYFNDKLVQVEHYHNCVPNKPPDLRIFDQYHFIYAR
jgi:hypothetical protein